MLNPNQATEMAHRGSWNTLPVSFDTAAARLPEVLQAQGFGVITQIDLQQTFKAKLGKDFRRYRIYGACNPAFALQAVEADPRVGLLLPCNIVLFEQTAESTMLGVIDPLQQLGAEPGPLATIAQTIAERLGKVAQALVAETPGDVR